MKTLLSISLIAVLAVAASADYLTSVAQPLRAEASPVDRSMLAYDMQAGPTNPIPISAFLTFAPGSSFGLAGVALPPVHGSKGWNGSACVETTIGSLALGRDLSLQSDALVGARFQNSGLTGGVGVGLYYSSAFNTVNNRLSWFVFAGVAYMASSGLQAQLGPQGAIGISIATK